MTLRATFTISGVLYSQSRRNLPRAERLLHEALTAAERSQNVDVVIACFSSLGNLHRQVGNLTEAARLYAGALEASASGRKPTLRRQLPEQPWSGHRPRRCGRRQKMIEELRLRSPSKSATSAAKETALATSVEFSWPKLGAFLGAGQFGTLESAREHVTIAMRIAQETGDAEKAGSG